MLDNSKNKKIPFKVPENYFEDFNTKIMEQLPIENKSKKVIPLWKKVLPIAVAVAACVVLIFNILPISNFSQDPQAQSYATTITEDEMFDIMEDQLIASMYQDVLYDEVYSK